MEILAPPPPRGGFTPGNSWWECATPFKSKSRPYFRPKNVVFHTRFQTRPLKSIYGHFQTWPRLFNSWMALYPAIG